MGVPDGVVSGSPITTNDVIVNEYPTAPFTGAVQVQQRPIVSGTVVDTSPSTVIDVPGPESAPLPNN
jgi:hypothetical protein